MTSGTAEFRAALLARHVTPAELGALARASDELFIRSVDQLAEDSPRATGRRLAALEALEAYGRETLAEVVAEGSALLCESPSAAGRALRERRELLKLEVRQVATRANVEPRVVEAAERSQRVSLRDYERIARVLGLDERFISVRAEPVGNERVAVRLRYIGEEHPRMSALAVSALAEAAWVASTQLRLEGSLGVRPPRSGIEPSWNYGGPGYPAHLQGYYLATDARDRLGFGGDPIPSLRELCEERLGVPVVQAELGELLAGATVETPGERRAIVLNLGGRNRHVYVRRATVAHELGHLLYDPSPQLKDLRVDDYEELDRPADQMRDPVEQRANAFAAELLAPQAAALDCYRRAAADSLGAVMDTFGVSYTLARYQVWNAMERRVPLETLTSTRREPEPTFEAREAYTTSYHPIRQVPTSRSGRFSAVVVRAAEERVISWQTAAEYLCCSEADARAASAALRDLYPGVFAPVGTG